MTDCRERHPIGRLNVDEKRARLFDTSVFAPTHSGIQPDAQRQLEDYNKDGEMSDDNNNK
jgi:hypothetical protein